MEAAEDIISDSVMSDIVSDATVTSTTVVATNTVTVTSATASTAKACHGAISKILTQMDDYTGSPMVTKFFLTGMVTLVLAGVLHTFFGRGDFLEKEPPAHKKVSPKLDEKPIPLTLEDKIENIQLRFANEYRVQIENLLTTFNGAVEQDVYNLSLIHI